MGLALLTDRNAVIAAMDEYDRLADIDNRGVCACGALSEFPPSA
jgi:hypothetical protein